MNKTNFGHSIKGGVILESPPSLILKIIISRQERTSSQFKKSLKELIYKSYLKDGLITTLKNEKKLSHIQFKRNIIFTCIYRNYVIGN